MLQDFKWSVKTIFFGFVLLLVILFLVSLITTGSAFFGGFQAKVTAPARVEQKIYDPNNIVDEVAFFTQTCNDVTRDYSVWKDNESSYKQQLALAQTASTQGQQTQAQDAATQDLTYVQGALANVQSDAADYNAKSENYTANPFKVKGLPYRINPPLDPSALSAWTPPSCG